MICSAGQASPWFDWCWSLASFSLLGSCFKTLVDLRFLPNDGHEARTWSCGTARLLSLQVYNVDIKPGQITKVLSVTGSCSYILVCILFVALCPYVSMGIVAYLGQLPAIYNVWKEFIWSCSLWETYVNFCRLLTNESGDSSCIVSLLYWSGDPQVRSTSFFTLIGWITIFSCGADIPVSYSMYYDSFDNYLYGIWNHIDTSQLNNAI